MAQARPPRGTPGRGTRPGCGARNRPRAAAARRADHSLAAGRGQRQQRGTGMSAITAAPLQPPPAAGTRPLLRVVRAEWERTLAWALAVAAAVLLFVGYRNVAA